MNFGIILSSFFCAIVLVLIFFSSGAMGELIFVNALVQAFLFIVVACIPFMRTGRMSYVDIAWPFGVALIGVQIILLVKLIFPGELLWVESICLSD